MAATIKQSGRLVYVTGTVDEVLDALVEQGVDNSDSFQHWNSTTSTVTAVATRV